MEIKSFGDKIVPGVYQVHSTFDKVINFTSGENFISLVTSEIASGPANIVVNDIDLSTISTLKISQSSLLINENKLKLSPDLLYSSSIKIDSFDPRRFFYSLDMFEELVCENARQKSLAFLLDDKRTLHFTSSFEKEVIIRFKKTIKALNENKIIEAINYIKGVGLGLTPSGDDFIAGLMIGLNLQSKLFKTTYKPVLKEIYTNAKSKNLISNHFLKMAEEGRVDLNFKNLINSLLSNNYLDVYEATLKVLKCGETSGADLAVGFLTCFNTFHCRSIV